MRGVNKVILVGTLGANPESKSFPNGGSLCNFSIATSEKFIMIYVSPCCKADLSIWDEDIEDYVAIAPKYYSNGE